jgi:hypothetical protein
MFTEYYVVCLEKTRASITGAADYDVELALIKFSKVALQLYRLIGNQ